MNETCGCCEGLEPLTPLATANRPGLSALAYRAGTHATFLTTMKARLSAGDYPVLDGLTTRAETDPSIALLDGWATVADVLTFYQERIANEGYLRTATERRSILELARLVGYAPRPGVASSVYLAFTLEEGYQLDIPAGTRAQSLPGPGELPQSFETAEKLEGRAAWNNLKPQLNQPQKNVSCARTLYLKGVATNLNPNDLILIDSGREEICRVISVTPDPAADRTAVTLRRWPQTSTDEATETREREPVAMPANLRSSSLHAFAARLKEVGNLSSGSLQGLVRQLAGALLETFGALSETPASGGRERAVEESRAALRNLERALVQVRAGVNERSLLAENVTKVLDWLDHALKLLEAGDGSTMGRAGALGLSALVDHLSRPAQPPIGSPTSALRLPRDLETSFSESSDATLQIVADMQPALGRAVYAARRDFETEQAATAKVYAFRTTASLFGHNAPREPKYSDAGKLLPWAQWSEWELAEDKNILLLDNAYDQILPGAESYIVVRKPNGEPRVFNNIGVFTRSRAAYGISGKTTQITLPDGEVWLDPTTETFDVIRGAVVYAQSEELALAEEPIAGPVEENSIDLEGFYDGLQSGRWLIVSGERADIPNVSGVMASEVVVLAGVTQREQQVTHSSLQLAQPLRHRYKRDTVTIHGNVVNATHGETREEVLGSGDSAEELQQFGLKQSPLTYVAATTPTGVESTLEVYVDDIRWHEAQRLVELEPTDRRFTTRTDDQDETTLVFGDGEHGARLPTGVENVRAVYRTGIGRPGNVAAEQISQLATRLLGLKGVINPQPATGGADRETRDQARRNAPLTVMTLDRLVSVRDYEDFARAFAGIGKASAVRLSDGYQRLVHLTIAGADDIPIAEESDLYRNLVQALRRFGDPQQPLRVEVRELILLIVGANVRVLPDYQWESVEIGIRAALLDTFGFGRRDLGQDALLSEAISTIQQVAGVAYVDVDTFGGIPEKTAGSGQRRLLLPSEIAQEMEMLAKGEDQPLQLVPAGLAGPVAGSIRPAQLAFLTPRVPDTLILKEITA